MQRWTRAGVLGCLGLGLVAASASALPPAKPGMAADGDMAGHMAMTALRPRQPGDEAKAEAIAAGAREVMARYTDYHKALADGYQIFLPDAAQKVYHFTLPAAAIAAEFQFDKDKPSSLLYEKAGEGYKLVGVMYTAPFRSTEEQLNERVPLSVAQWHLHTNLCLPPGLTRDNFEAKAADLVGPSAKFGLEGSITTQAACAAAGGTFRPHVFGWMVHVYAFEKDPAKVWAAGMNDAHDHGMEHGDGMGMPGMKM